MYHVLARDIALLIARIGLGVVFIAHGWQKFFTNTISGTQQSFDKMGVPLADISAIIAATVELVGGFALLVGAFVPVAGVLLFLTMAGALFVAHVDNGIFASAGGYELVLVLGVGALLIGVIGAGRISVDGLLGKSNGWFEKSDPAPIAAA